MDLVAGATGHVGGRPVQRLLEKGRRVRVLARDPARLAGCSWAFGLAAREAGVKRIVYLAGLGAAGTGLSNHLRSRQETGEALRGGGVPVTEFRVAVIVGSGSISFEMTRWLVERLQVMIFWRVEAVEPGRMLRLPAEMKVPGRAWLQFEARPCDGGSLLSQTAYFAPRGLADHRYWCVLYPVHAAMFSSMVRRVADRGRSLADAALPGGAT
jgi:hypothetical protein